ncbi:MAG: hypothetical protein A2015_09565 [Spirochaetes bacterium GWF1_31_7]|nr:MAG: hypothetical protein A2Y30_01255 [Spirochaetes bacterium GWE1_32_154]OHD45100.1 MAG: hypothetical protein A2Y29_15300 [Spirochaetes bacterium GWE2_31_10]OHD52667.1 MAG: hypothetical protein A2015_09565 [Spirochaetes bacterium GWF1_31_7]OHD75875.1 MAG: hypothetical protein A2355_04170 [Spirochaetes bacterium RIFOXYB1_FULL_32_8]
MKHFFRELNDVKAVIAEGYISLYETVNLKKGDIVRFDTQAGESSAILINNHRTFRGEIVVCNEIVGFRVTSINAGESKPYQGAKDSITEILKTQLVINSIELSIEDLMNIHTKTIINLDCLYDDKNYENVYLYISGVKVAGGRTQIYDEYFAIEITEVYTEMQTRKDIAVRSSGYIIDSDKVRGYDFRRPDKVTYRQILRMKDIHISSLRMMKIVLPEIRNYSVLKVDQCSYSEITKQLADNYSYYIVNTSDALRRDGNTIKDQNFVVQRPEFTYKLNEEAITFITKLMSNRFVYGEKSFIICSKKTGFFNTIQSTESISELIVEPVRNAWKEIRNFNFSGVSTIKENAGCDELIPEHDMVITIEIGDDKSGSDLVLIYPYIFLESVLEVMG